MEFKRIESRDSNRYLHINVHSNIIHNSLNVEAISKSIDGCMDNQNVVCIIHTHTHTHIHTHTMECYSVLKRTEILIHATTWLGFENITFSEISQAQRDKYSIIPFIGCTYNR